jgi:predicted PurR-regulated permease PerM
MDRRIFFTLMIFSLLLGFLYLVYSILAPFLETLGWAAVIGISTFPLYRRLRNRFPGRDTAAASIMTPAVILTLVIPFALMITLLTAESAGVYQYLEKMATGGGPDLLENVRRNPHIRPLLESIQPLLGSFELDMETTLLPALKNLASYLLGYSTALIKNFFVMIIKLVLMVITLFFLYRDGEGFLQRVISVLPLGRADIDMLMDTVKRVISAVIYGILLTCFVQGALGGVGFWMCGLPSPPLFGALMAVSALIPVVGTALIWLPGALWLILQGEVLKGVFLLAWGALVVGMIDNFIRPFFISGKAHLSILVIALGVLGGVFAFGPLGVVTGPIVLAIFLALFEIYARRVFPGVPASPEAGGDAQGDA